MTSKKTVDNYIETAKQWQAELKTLRKIILTTNLEETVKWGMPYYCLSGKNIVGMVSFKSYFGLWFTQGAFLKDEAGVLLNAKEGKTRGLRQWRMNSKNEINSKLIKRYVMEAIEVTKSGKAIKPVRHKTFEVSPELILEMDNNSVLKASFETLTQSQKREYSEYINSAKRDETKARRLAKIIPMILSGAGLNDKYRT